MPRIRHRSGSTSGFFSDREGQVAVTFGLTVLPMLLVTGAAIDYSRAVAQRSNLQQATDAAVLALAHNNVVATSTATTLQTPAKAYLSGMMSDATLASLTLDATTSEVCIKTTANVPTMFMKIANYKNVPVGASACALPNAAMTYEVAMALDNSGSMTDAAGSTTKIAALKTAAQQLVDILNPSGTTSPTAAISLIPFTALVNVGTSKTASFLDTEGKSSIHWQNFHRPPATVLAPFYPTTKFDLFSGIGVAWAGCVEERPSPLITTDTAASASNPDSLFVPFLSPDDPGDTNLNHCFYLNPATQLVNVNASCSNLGSGLLNNHQFYNSYLYDTGAVNPKAACLLNPLAVTADTTTLLPFDSQPNIYPAAGATMVCKYNAGSAVQTYQGVGLTTGPNYLCSSNKLTPLTTDRTVLSSAVTAMQAGGSTNLATGFMWAWRTISPIVAPFPVSSASTIGQQNPKAYTTSTVQKTNRKIIILMTDGFNSWTGNGGSPWLSTYEAFGYYANNRIASYGTCSNSGTSVATTASTYRCQMDNVTLEACTNAKATGITVYTVGLTVPSNPIDAQGISLLQNCASTSADYFQASDGASIVAAFQKIAQSIQALRLTQ